MKIVTAAEMREIDRRTTAEFGVSSLTLMENAGTEVADFCLQQYPTALCMGVICGKGNNGGDGLVCARKLHEAGKSVSVLLLADASELKGDAAEMLKRLPVTPVMARNVEELQEESAQEIFQHDLLVDAILGTGFKPPVKGVYAAAIQATWAAFAPVVSVDLPSGEDADATSEADASGTVARSSAIVTFTAPKPALALLPLTDGPIVVAEIGTPPEAIESKLGLNVISWSELAFLRVLRDRQANKGSFGHVLVLGGSRGKAGAAGMAGIAALRAGTGLCTVATAAGVQDVVAGFAPELMTEGLPETEAGTISLRALDLGRTDGVMQGKSVLAIGPGISRNPESAEFVRTLVHRRRVPVVLDADGLNAFENDAERLEGSGLPLVVTPHPGEMARLTGLSVADVQRDRSGTARKFARDHNCIVVLKGWRTLVAEPSGTVWVNTTGNPGMATGGTGDVLTGSIAGLMAQYPGREVEAVRAAVHVHGLAGDIAAAQGGERSLIASDVIGALPEAFAQVRQPRPRSFEPLQQPRFAITSAQ